METDYFQGVSREHVQGLCEAFQIAYLPADEVIFRTGDDGDAWYLVISGAVRIAGNRADGSPLEFAVVEPGDGFGEIALLDEGLRSADAITTSPTSLARLPRAAFLELLTDGQPAAVAMLRAISARLSVRLRELSWIIQNYSIASSGSLNQRAIQTFLKSMLMEH